MTKQAALITGAARGIGRATAERLIADGWRVWISDVSADTAKTAEEIGAEHVHLDVTDPGAWEDALATVSASGGLDLLYLNAGIMAAPIGAPIGSDPWPWLSPEILERVARVNVEGPLNGILAVKFLAEQFRPRDVVITASIAGMSALTADPIYSATKHAVIGLTRSLAQPLAAIGIRLQAICPGGVDTAIVAPDLRIPGRHFAPASYIADGVLNALLNGEAGDVWMASDSTVDFWKFEFPPVRPSGQTTLA